MPFATSENTFSQSRISQANYIQLTTMKLPTTPGRLLNAGNTVYTKKIDLDYKTRYETQNQTEEVTTNLTCKYEICIFGLDSNQ